MDPRGRGAGPGGFPAGSLLCSLSHHFACTCLSILFPGSQLIPRDSCSLCESGRRPGPDPRWGTAPNHQLRDAEGIFPQGPHPGICSGLTGGFSRGGSWVGERQHRASRLGFWEMGGLVMETKWGKTSGFGLSCGCSFPPEPAVLPSHSRARWCSGGLGFPPSRAQFPLFTLYFSGKGNRSKSPGSPRGGGHEREPQHRPHRSCSRLVLDGIPWSWAPGQPLLWVPVLGLLQADLGRTGRACGNTAPALSHP